MNHITNYRKLGYAGFAAVVIGGAAYREIIHDLIQPRAPVPPVTEVYNNNSCLAYDGGRYVLFKEIARKGEGIDALLSRHNPRPYSALREEFKAANKMETNMLHERRQYLTPAPDYENKCK